jgi:uncharacterized protein
MKRPGASARRSAVGWLAASWLAASSVGHIGCASSPEPQFYALYPSAGSALTSQPLQVELRRPGLPGYLDRPQIVRRREPEKLEFSSDDRWGAPLQDMIGSVLAQNLAQRLPGTSVYTESGAISSSPDAVVELDLQRFELSASGSVELTAQVALHWEKSAAASRLDLYTLSRRSKGPNTGQLVTQMNGLLAELADGIAASIRAGAPRPPRGATLDPAPADLGAPAPE